MVPRFGSHDPKVWFTWSKGLVHMVQRFGSTVNKGLVHMVPRFVSRGHKVWLTWSQDLVDMVPRFGSHGPKVWFNR